MQPDLAFHPKAADTFPRPPITGGEGIGVPVDPATGQGVRPVSGDVEPSETRLTLATRTYNGVRGAELSVHSEDIWNMLSGGLRLEGAGARAYARMSAALATAVWAYIVVKNALALLAAPLRPKASDKRALSMRRPRGPQAPTTWLTKPPSETEWTERDARAGYDVRGTSPTWVRRRVYRHRVRRRRALEAPYEREARLARRNATVAPNNATFIGPPIPRHYKDVADMGMIWPPVPRPGTLKGTLPPVGAAEFISGEVRAHMSEAAVEEADALITSYNAVLEQFGVDATFNYLSGLGFEAADFMTGYIRAHLAWFRKTRAPP